MDTALYGMLSRITNNNIPPVASTTDASGTSRNLSSYSDVLLKSLSAPNFPTYARLAAGFPSSVKRPLQADDGNVSFPGASFGVGEDGSPPKRLSYGLDFFRDRYGTNLRLVKVFRGNGGSSSLWVWRSSAPSTTDHLLLYCVAVRFPIVVSIHIFVLTGILHDSDTEELSPSSLKDILAWGDSSCSKAFFSMCFHKPVCFYQELILFWLFRLNL